MAAKTGRRRLWLAGVAGLLVLGVGALVVLRGAPPRTDADARRRIAGQRPAPGELNVVVVTLDTLRADRLGCYGFRGIETPNIDAVASEGVLFEQATSTVPLTLPSHTSIFTGSSLPTTACATTAASSSRRRP